MGPVSTTPRALLAVADILGLCGTVTIHGRDLAFNGKPVLTLNLSDALVLPPVYDGHERVEPAQNVPKGRSAADVAADILERFAGRKAA